MPEALVDFSTADLSDMHDGVEVLEPIFRSFGTRRCWHGPVSTVKVFEDNSLVRQALEEPGRGRVLVVDGGGSLRCALVGDVLAQLAVDNGWAGLLVYGCIRDSRAIDALPIGIKALQTHPRKSVKRGQGERDLAVTFAGQEIRAWDFVYADEDGVLISPRALL